MNKERLRDFFCWHPVKQLTKNPMQTATFWKYNMHCTKLTNIWHSKGIESIYRGNHWFSVKILPRNLQCQFSWNQKKKKIASDNFNLSIAVLFFLCKKYNSLVLIYQTLPKLIYIQDISTLQASMVPIFISWTFPEGKSLTTALVKV